MNKMKLKLSALAALLLLANPAWADQVTITQNNSSNTGTVHVEQTGGSHNSNYAEVVQDYYSSNEQAYVTQAGEGNQTTHIKQYGNYDNVNVTQSGNAGIATITQNASSIYSTTTVTQDVGSSLAYVEIVQDNGANHATVNQNSSTGDIATINQNAWGSWDYNEVNITQSLNFGTETASVNQNGAQNRATINQSSGTLDKADISQTGYGNRSTIDQTSTSNENAQIIQSSNSNLATIIQSGSTLDSAKIDQGYTDSNIATILQSGTNSEEASIIQRGLGNNTDIQQLSSMDDHATVNQKGDYDTANIHQTSTNDSHGTVDQQSDYDTANIYQTSTSDAHATVDQRSDYNAANIYQTSTNNTYASIFQGVDASNSATINQFAATAVNGNIVQNGNHNTALIEQGTYAFSGISNSSATITQTGNNNSASISQIGDNKHADVSQVGNGNSIIITQH